MIRKIVEADVNALEEITDNENAYRHICRFCTARAGELLAEICKLGGRDFVKKKRIVAVVYLRDAENTDGRYSVIATLRPLRVCFCPSSWCQRP